MAGSDDRKQAGSLMGAVYGDLIGAPYMIENTYNRYFELGESRRAYSHGRVRTFFPEVTEVSHGASAVASWLSIHRDNPTVESLIGTLHHAYDRHPRGGWTEATRLFLTGEGHGPSQTSDWAAVTRAIPVASFVRDDLPRAMELSDACVKATCDSEEAAAMARAVTHVISMGLDGRILPEVRTVLEMQYGLRVAMSDEDLRAELRGEVREPLVMMGAVVEGAYRYVLPDSPSAPSSRVVTEAAMKAVLGSDSWEDAVRRAVSYGGPSNAVAAIAGGIAEAFYGEVTPSVIGKLSSHLPIDIGRQLESVHRAPSVTVRRESSVFSSIERDAVGIVSLGPGRTVYVVPEDRKDVRGLIGRSVPDPVFTTLERLDDILDPLAEKREGTYPYGIRPEWRTLYVQDGQRLVSPSQYVAPGMPPVQERKRHLEEFLKLRSWCVNCQKELNRLAGNEGAGQIHYGNAYHLWVGSRRIDFMMGDQLCGRISLDGRGLLRLELGEQMSIGADARFENHREQSWAARGIFSIQDSIRPMDRLQQIRDEISYRLLDCGNGGESHELDTRYLSEDERGQQYGVSNVDHLEKLDGGVEAGMSPADAAGLPPDTEKPVEGRAQATDRIFSIGYGARTREGFINTLKMSGIDTVVDVRSIPRSRYAPHFNEDVIYDALDSEGIGYLSAGETLGGRLTDPSLYENGRVSWEKAAADGSFRSSVGSLEKLCSDGHIVAVVCSEGDPLSCHRFGLLSRALNGDGMDVRHILSNGEVVTHEEMEARLVERYEKKNRLSSVISGTYRDQLNEAYHLMNEEYGYRPKGPQFRMGSCRRMKY